MIEFEKIINIKKPSLVVVVGDVNSTIACALVAKKLNIKVAHVEAGLRSDDIQMPEEINRILTDHISDFLFTSERSADNNLRKEGIVKERIYFVGNIMIDSLIMNIEKAKKLYTHKKFNLKKGCYALITLHRPSNVDIKIKLLKLIEIIEFICSNTKAIFPMHPRTMKNFIKFSLLKNLENNNLIITEPLGYLEFLELLINSKFILTDSGGIQEEASYLDIPVLTLRKETERPITEEQGSNIVVGDNKYMILYHVKNILNGKFIKAKKIKYWDGKTSQRIVKTLIEKGLIEK